MVKTLKKNKTSISLRRKGNKLSRKHKRISKVHRNRKQRGGDIFDDISHVEKIKIDNNFLIQIPGVTQGYWLSSPLKASQEFFNKLMETIHNNENLKVLTINNILTIDDYDYDKKKYIQVMLEGLFLYKTPEKEGIQSFGKLKQLEEMNIDIGYPSNIINTDILIDFFRSSGKQRFKIERLKLIPLEVTIAGLYNLCVLELSNNIGKTYLSDVRYTTGSYELSLNLKKLKDKLKEGLLKNYTIFAASLYKYQKKEFGLHLFDKYGLSLPGLELKKETQITHAEILACCSEGIDRRDFEMISLLLKLLKDELTEYYNDNQNKDDNLYIGWKIIDILLMDKTTRKQRFAFLDELNKFFGWIIFQKEQKLYREKQNNKVKTQLAFLKSFSFINSFTQFQESILNNTESLKTTFPQFTDDVISKYKKLYNNNLTKTTRTKHSLFNNNNNNNNNNPGKRFYHSYGNNNVGSFVYSNNNNNTGNTGPNNNNNNNNNTGNTAPNPNNNPNKNTGNPGNPSREKGCFGSCSVSG